MDIERVLKLGAKMSRPLSPIDCSIICNFIWLVADQILDKYDEIRAR